MATIVISTNVSLDGVVEDPDGQEGFERGGWFTRAAGADRDAWAAQAAAEADDASALLLGRHSDAWFAARWSNRAGAWAARLNALPKYVVSSRPTADWTNATVLPGEPVAEAARLKRELSGTVLVYASYRLARTLLDAGLVDEVRLVVFPVVVGAGARLFGSTPGETALRLLGVRPVGGGLVQVRYAVG